MREEVERLTINQASVTFGKLSSQKLFQEDDANDGHFWYKRSHDNDNRYDGAEVDYDDNVE